MDLDLILFLAAAVFSLASILFTIESRNIVHSVVYLALFFLGISGLFALLNAGFFAIAQILMFVGGFVVLLVLAIMLAREANVVESLRRFPAQWVLVALFLGLTIAFLLSIASAAISAPSHAGVSSISGVLFGQYAVVLDLAGFLLLSAVFGSVYLIHKGEAV